MCGNAEWLSRFKEQDGSVIGEGFGLGILIPRESSEQRSTTAEPACR
ncbi:hypothetical protein KM043_018886, partial [Ampulex compressa]